MNKATTKIRPDLAYRDAGLLDVPLIFQLMQDGAEAGAFSDAFVGRMGSIILLRYVLSEIVMQPVPSPHARAQSRWYVINERDGAELGVMKRSQGVGTGHDYSLDILAIAPKHRNQGIGTAVFEDILALVPQDAQLYVHCTKYARAMQHIVKRHGMKRNVSFQIPRLEEFSRGEHGWAKPKSRT